MLATHIFGNFHPDFWGFMIQFDLHIFCQLGGGTNHLDHDPCIPSMGWKCCQNFKFPRSPRDMFITPRKIDKRPEEWDGWNSDVERWLPGKKTCNFWKIRGAPIMTYRIKIWVSWWWFQIFFIFTPVWGRWAHFDKHIFQMGGSTTNQV